MRNIEVGCYWNRWILGIGVNWTQYEIVLLLGPWHLSISRVRTDA